MDRRWKRVERKVAERLGGKRVPITGRQRGSAPDIAHGLLSIEVKDRKAFPAWLVDAVDQAVASRQGEQIPMVVLHQRGWSHAKDLVVVFMEDWCDLFGDAQGRSEAAEGLP